MNRYGPGWVSGFAVVVGIAIGPVVFLSANSQSSPYVVGSLEVLLLVGVGIGISYGMVLIHELGHALAALGLRIPLTEFSVGSGPRLCSFRVREVDVAFRMAPGTGHVAWRLTHPPVPRWRLSVLLIAGVASETLFAATFAAQGSFPREFHAFGDALQFYAFCAIPLTATLHLLGSLNPERNSGTDGEQLLQLWTGAHQAADAELTRQLLEAEARAKAGDTLGALKVWEGIVRQKPAEPRYKLLLTSLYMGHGDFDSAEALGRELLKSIPKQLRCHLLDTLACLPLYSQRPAVLPDADGWSDEAMRLAPDAITVKGTRGSVLVELGRWDEGIALLEPVSRRSEETLDRAIAHAFLAKAYAAKGLAERSASSLQRALELQASHPAVQRIAAELAGAPAPRQAQIHGDDALSGATCAGESAAGGAGTGVGTVGARAGAGGRVGTGADGAGDRGGL